MNAAELMVQCLETEGVRFIFGIPGEENLDLLNALADSSIRFITTRHEQGAAFMADVYGRLTGRAGVCLATLGPGATNLITGVADANSDGAPLVAITGQVGIQKQHITAHQYLNLEQMFQPVTKRTKMVMGPETVAEVVRLAFKYAEMGKMGATHIDFPVDVAKMPVVGQEAPLQRVRPAKEYASLSSVKQAACMIASAKNPILLAGSDAVRGQAGEAITEFANDLRIPVVNTMMGKGLISYENPYSLWTIGIPQRDFPDLAMEQADMVIAVGYDIVELSPSRWNPLRDKRILHIHTDAAHINKHYQAELQVIGDIVDALGRIRRRCRRESLPEAMLQIRSRMLREHEAYAQDEAFPMKPQRILWDVRKVMGPEDIVLSDVGAHKMWIARHYNCHRPNTCLISNGFASMGFALPGALAAKLLNRERKVLVVTGDGGFMMNCQELETARREGIPFVTLIFNDESYGLIRWKQMDQFGVSRYTDFTNPDFAALARSMHLKGYRVEKAADLIPMLDEAFRQSVPTVIDCKVDYRENEKLSRYLSALSLQTHCVPNKATWSEHASE